MPYPIYQPVTYYNNTITTSSTANGYYVYQQTWSSTSITTAWANDVVWQNWNLAYPATGSFAPAPDPAREERHQERQLATVRARTLLEGFLSDEQKAELVQGFFHVVGSRGRRYRIRTYGQAGNVELLRPDGALQARLCAHPCNGLPDGDAWLMQLITIRNDEDSFLAVANLHAGCLPGDFYAAAA